MERNQSSSPISDLFHFQSSHPRRLSYILKLKKNITCHQFQFSWHLYDPQISPNYTILHQEFSSSILTLDHTPYLEQVSVHFLFSFLGTCEDILPLTKTSTEPPVERIATHDLSDNHFRSLNDQRCHAMSRTMLFMLSANTNYHKTHRCNILI